MHRHDHYVRSIVQLLLHHNTYNTLPYYYYYNLLITVNVTYDGGRRSRAEYQLIAILINITYVKSRAAESLTLVLLIERIHVTHIFSCRDQHSNEPRTNRPARHISALRRYCQSSELIRTTFFPSRLISCPRADSICTASSTFSNPLVTS